MTVIKGGWMPVIHLTKADFQEKTAKGVVLVDFFAPWCGPCKMVGPTIDELADEYQDKALLAKVNVDYEAELAQQFQVLSVPTVLLLKDGKEVERSVGFMSKETYKELLNKHIK